MPDWVTFFYEWDYYAENLMEIPMVWKGGLASHGAAIALIFLCGCIQKSD